MMIILSLLLLLNPAFSVAPEGDEFLPVEVTVTEVRDGQTVIYELVNRSDMPITAWAVMTTSI